MSASAAIPCALTLAQFQRRKTMIKTHIKLLPLALVLSLAGCITNGISVRAISDPKSTLTKQSPVFIDALTDVSIEYRKAFESAAQIASKAGLDVVDESDAEYIIRLNYRRGLRYNPKRDEFRQDLVFHSSAKGTKIGNSGTDYGVINAGVFPLRGRASRSAWEGTVEVNDMSDPAEVEISLMRLFEKFGEDFRGDVPGLSPEK
jgi:hypothetical protein